MALKLLSESVDVQELEYIVEEKNLQSPGSMYIKGPYILVGEVNKNRRMYEPEEMQLEVTRYNTEMIIPGRALGELNHPASAEVDLERACHKIVELKESGNVYIGKSKLLSSPLGQLTKNLILQDQVKIGVSTRCLGKLIAEGSYNRVKSARIVAIDCVADPSAPSAFVNGILESKQFILESNGHLREVYEVFEESLESLPKKDLNDYLREQITAFIRKISA